MPRRVLRNVLITAILSRALIFFLLVIGSQIAFLGKDYGNTIWRTEIDLKAERLLPELTRMVMVGDAWHYEKIAREGYEPRGADGAPRNTWAFFPLFPLLVRVLPDFAIGAVVLSNLMFVAGLLLVAAAGLRLGATEEQVERAAFFIAFFPTSYFFSLPMTEALFLMLSAAAFYFAAKEKWWAAGIVGALAASTRFVGILLLPALLLMPRRKAPLLLIPIGTAAFMAFLYRLTGDPLAFVKAQALWGRGSLQWPLSISVPWNFVALNVAAAVFLVIAGVGLFRERKWAFAAYTLMAVAIPISTGSLQSLARYSMVVFPAFLWLAAKTEKTERWVAAVFIILLGWMLTMFVLRVDFALA
jgi:Gpi18-like mannosyltransferase